MQEKTCSNIKNILLHIDFCHSLIHIMVGDCINFENNLVILVIHLHFSVINIHSKVGDCSNVKKLLVIRLFSVTYAWRGKILYQCQEITCYMSSYLCQWCTVKEKIGPISTNYLLHTFSFLSVMHVLNTRYCYNIEKLLVIRLHLIHQFTLC